MKRFLLLLISHGVVLAVGVMLGIYLLPILTAPPSPDAAQLQERAETALFTGTLKKDLRGSDFLHWGEGEVSVSAKEIIHEGKLSPGPDYKVYLTKQFVDHEDTFNPVKAEAVYIGDVKSFEGFILGVPAGVDVNAYNTVVVWCESFGEFITAAQYK